MNVKNNKRRRASQQKLEQAFLELLQTREIKEITVSELISRAGLNRSTFYANYVDIFDLADQARGKLEHEFQELFADQIGLHGQNGALRLFTHIKANQQFYQTYFKLCNDDRHLLSVYDVKRAEQEHMDSNLKYHIEFFRNGLNSIIKLWLADGCRESPEEMAEVLKQEYKGRSVFPHD